MRVYVGGISQETNTFSPRTSGLDVFERGYLLEGADIRTMLRKTNTEISGFHSHLELLSDVEIVPGFAAWAVTYGKVTDRAFERLTTRLIDTLKEASPVDGVLLFLHGSMVSESVDDCEGFILSRVRDVVGTGIPVVSTLDLHACMTEKMVEKADVLVGYRTYPHIDLALTGERAAKCLVELIKTRQRMRKVFYRIPFIPAVENCATDHGPMVPAMTKLAVMDGDPAVQSVSLFMPQPWLDTYDTRAAIVLYVNEGHSTGNQEERARSILDDIWERRREFFLQIPDILHFVRNASDYERPVCVVDLGDIVSAGGIGDSTVILRAFIEHKFGLRCVLCAVDGESVRRAATLGEGNSGWFDIGGTNDYGYNSLTKIYATVVKLNDDIITAKGASLTGVRLNAGRRALLRTNDTIHIIISEYSYFNHDPEIVRSMGLNPEDMDVIVQKTHQMFKAGYKGIMKSYVYADTPGFTDRNLERLPFRKVKRPVYPLDKDFAMELGAPRGTGV